MICTTKQIEVLNWLNRYKYLCVSQFHENLFCGTTRRNAEIALQKLAQKGLIKRLRLPRYGEDNFGMICHLTQKGLSYLESENLTQQSNKNQPIKRPIRSANHYRHRKKLVDFLIRLDLSIALIPNLKLKCLLTEFRVRESGKERMIETTLQNEQSRIVPDAIFVIQNKQSFKEVTFCVEIDTTTEIIGGDKELIPVDSILAKFQTYEQFLVSGHWRTEVKTTATAFQVLFVTENHQHLRTVFERMAGTLEHPQFFLGSTHDALVAKNILTCPCWLKIREGKPQSLLT